MQANLMRAAFSNCFSVRDTQEIFFTAESKYSSDKDQAAWNLIGDKKNLEDFIVPITVFYGANASGKSTVLSAIRRLAKLFERYKRKPARLSRNPFVLDKDKPSTLEYDFYLNQKIYSYSITYNDDEFIEEHLWLYIDSTKNVIYDRKTKEFNIDFISEQTRKELLEITSTRKDVLFLELLTLRALSPFKEIYDFFEALYSQKGSQDAAKILYSDEDLKKRVENFIQFADLGISEIIADRRALDPEKLQLNKKLYHFLEEAIGSEEANILQETLLNEEVEYEYFIRFNHDSIEKKFEISDRYESAGTERFLDLLIKFLPAFLKGGVFLIDELEDSLHPMLLVEIIKMFHSPCLNKAGAQLIFTTHDTNLLKPDLLRRDEIWFVEKNKKGETTSYPLSDFTDVRNNYNYEKGYLEGRFGAIPYLGDVNNLISLRNEKV